ncbi:response regulator [Sphingomonas sp. LaA6.9]|uniref:response regulator n=1 Tax=Sphingomonas sp. LaA6.9 TaxID=2919914 RepID=UPI001F500462|nr:response regulator [Sphingomonas sp. LaA6.9]MCJ8158206.1 response regulator [Sphingomonas sp. LaA6.9]
MGQERVPAGLKVLLVEDNGMLAETATELLEDMGCAVVHCADSAEAAMDWIDHGGELDLLLTDVVMPGMNGVELAWHVREQIPDLPVLLVSGYGDALLVEQQRQFPMVAKPYRSEEIARAIGGVITVPAS